MTVDTFHALIAAGVDKFSITQHGATMGSNIQALFAHVEGNSNLTHRIRYDRFDPATPLYNRGGLIQPAVVNTTPRCSDPGNPVAIDYAGNVILCCHDYHSSVIFGNIRTEKLLDIWFSPRYRAIRKQLRNGEYRLPICRKCVGQA
ncbi:MAG: SPASM domain-containing protein [Desulfobulbus sp.]|uniref:SPASM domain-containing protein n=1 Tax=Desulfobulbus sp. TaxID=895 RepID=UPI002845A387|nr:SPASM domain-containing protein [Desulfobulbus sp.]MDR2550178.1 SPASM domain-containing protein [Desulfobulbus sp.]